MTGVIHTTMRRCLMMPATTTHMQMAPHVCMIAAEAAQLAVHHPRWHAVGCWRRSGFCRHTLHLRRPDRSSRFEN